jgi:cell division protease FtsH
MSGPDRRPPEGPQPPPETLPPEPWFRWLLPVALLLGLWVALAVLFGSATTAELGYSSFVDRVDAGQVAQVTIDPDGAVEGELRDGTVFRTQIPTALDTTLLTERLEEQGVTVRATGPRVTGGQLLVALLPLLLLVGVFLLLFRRAGSQLAGGVSGFGRSKIKLVDAERPTTRFDDVAGYAGVKREVGEIIDFLRAPERYRRAGAIAPRGVLMLGPPGTGKTLLARAVAGEAEVPFLSVNGSSFVEMFVGVGAARVRDLFDEARTRAPCIIFIDEIDALGARRSGGPVISNDEREQTLNQLLAEMDGFDPAEGIAVLAATNRPEALDPALLRPGRFDRQIVIPLPSQRDRLAILDVHAADKRLADDVELDALARGTPGFSGADLANLVNEAAINAVRDNRTVLSAADFDAARDRIILGRREESTVLLPEEERAVAYHEAGHALVAALSEHADPVAKVTILPTGAALGATHQLPLDERHLHSESYLVDGLSVRLGGRAAELLVLGEASTGAANDLTSATDLATKMVRQYGLSPRLGPVGYGTGGPMYLGSQEIQTRPYAEATQQLIDEEVSRLVREAERRAGDLLSAHRTELDRLADLLIEQETVDGEIVYALLGRAPPQVTRDARTVHASRTEAPHRRPGVSRR